MSIWFKLAIYVSPFVILWGLGLWAAIREAEKQDAIVEVIKEVLTEKAREKRAASRFYSCDKSIMPWPERDPNATTKDIYG